MDDNKSSNHIRDQPLPRIPTAVALQDLQVVVHDLPCATTKQQLCTLIDGLVATWSDQHDALMDVFQTLQQRHSSLEHGMNAQTVRYHKAVRETQFYQSKYEALVRSYNRLSLSSNQTGGSLSSCSSSNSSITTAYPLCVDGCDEPFDILSLLNYVGDNTQASLPAETALTTPIATGKKDKEVPKDLKNAELIFACTDGFWDTIARGKSDKTTVDGLVSKYLQRGGNPNVAKITPTLESVKEGYSLVHALVVVRNISALKRVIDSDANLGVYPLSKNDEDHYSPVVLAAKLGYLDCLRLLIEKGHVDVLKSYGPKQQTALHAAIEQDMLDVIIYLLQLHPRLLTCLDVAGATPLHYACMNGKTRLVTLLVRDCRVASTQGDHKGETPLHYAVRYRQPKIVAKLVGDLGVYPNPYVLKQVLTPLDLAKSLNQKAITNYLKGAGAKTTKEMEKMYRKSDCITTSSSDCSSGSKTEPKHTNIPMLFRNNLLL
ncbi:hypothetical protein DFQ28_003450 [Apophysomyces sp. BC1034]|nr:hypothetical protein DFQ30_001444 [Apophysomyces sp. BC1015]KAG0182971.1 hypothetical protein DFQ29_001115 [Apophysomyces sp. BC1021]KAG0193779.1 hypothetical protein DFQ28_003450 [Apophysomyces sp. BC1034]